MPTRFKLDPAPTFRAGVLIPIPGAKPDRVEFVFKWRDREGIRQFVEGLPRDGELTVDQAVDADATAILAAAEGWELEEPFDRENLRRLCRNYPRAGQVVVDTYLDELTKAREKN